MLCPVFVEAIALVVLQFTQVHTLHNAICFIGYKLPASLTAATPEDDSRKPTPIRASVRGTLTHNLQIRSIPYGKAGPYVLVLFVTYTTRALNR